MRVKHLARAATCGAVGLILAAGLAAGLGRQPAAEHMHMPQLSSFGLGASAAPASAQSGFSTQVVPSQARTIYVSRCNGPVLTTPGTNCRGFDATQIRNDPTIFLVGFENNADLAEKHVFQTVAVFDLGAVTPPPNQTVASAILSYDEGSTVHRSAGGDAQYGILPTCATNLGVPLGPWNGSSAPLLQTVPANVAGGVGATTGGSGSWDITPQLLAWLAAGAPQGTPVLYGDDQSPDIHGQAMCLSYVSDLALSVQFAPSP